MITLNKDGGRTIQLFIPFEFNGRKIESVTLSPLRFGHVLGWNEGKWATTVALLTEMSGLEENVIRELRYPDADRVMESFMTMLTPEMRNDVESGRIPVKPIEELIPPETSTTTNGSGQSTQGPGAPIPPEMMQPGFDLSDEP